MKKLIYLFGLVILLSGCATASQLNQISIGMSKDEVIKKMGQPSSTSAIDNKEYLNYRLVPSAEPAYWAYYEPYFICIQDGKVASYGKKGDFGTSQLPTQVIQVTGDLKTNENIKIQSSNTNKP